VSKNSVNRRKFVAGLAATVVAPAVLRLATRPLSAQTLNLAGDGRTNDLAAIREMLVEAERRGRGTIKLPEGRFLLASGDKSPALVLPANVRLEGAGADRTTLLMADGAFGHVISGPYGWVQIADLTVDGNESNRSGTGHNFRLTGDHITIERVRSINALSYSIALGQRRFARNVVIRDVEIVNAGSDGIDIKNDLDRTENILIENVTVRGFGRPLKSLAPNLVGTASDVRNNKAGVDLRGRCEVRGLTVEGVLADRDGLRFRHGEKGEGHGAGAHGSKASNVTISGGPGGKASVGISVVARDIHLENIRLDGTDIGIFAGAKNLTVSGGRIGRVDRAALFARPTRISAPDRIDVEGVHFQRGSRFTFRNLNSVQFKGCEFEDCREVAKANAVATTPVEFVDCRFAETC